MNSSETVSDSAFPIWQINQVCASPSFRNFFFRWTWRKHCLSGSRIQEWLGLQFFTLKSL